MTNPPPPPPPPNPHSLPNVDAEIRGLSEHTLSSEGLLQNNFLSEWGNLRALSSVQILAKKLKKPAQVVLLFTVAQMSYWSFSMGSVPTGGVKGSLVGMWYNLLLLERPGCRYSEDESFCGFLREDTKRRN